MVADETTVVAEGPADLSMGTGNGRETPEEYQHIVIVFFIILLWNLFLIPSGGWGKIVTYACALIFCHISLPCSCCCCGVIAASQALIRHSF